MTAKAAEIRPSARAETCEEPCAIEMHAQSRFGGPLADRLKPVKGQREIVFPQKPGKRTPRARYLTYKQVDGNVYWLEVNEILDNGQYCLTPRGANDVFCFEIY